MSEFRNLSQYTDRIGSINCYKYLSNKSLLQNFTWFNEFWIFMYIEGKKKERAVDLECE